MIKIWLIVFFLFLNLVQKVNAQDFSIMMIDESLEKKLNVPLIKQTDSRWSAIEYDSAENWASNTGIGSWGCAMTSVVMIFKYYGLNKLPNGFELTPLTLNAWLKTQPDGYIGNGLLNWLAVTRLAREISDQYSLSYYQLPKLEYNRLTGATRQKALAELENDRPVILEIPGHFLVAEGWIFDHFNLYIKDPAYSFDTFDYHHTEPVSVRTFTPSQTDLSYLLFVIDSQLDLQLTNEYGVDIEPAVFTESIAEFNGDEQTEVKLAVLPKPASGNYQVKVSSENLQPEENNLKIYAYDQEANVSILEQEFFIQESPVEIDINYSKQSSSSAQVNYSWLNLQSDLEVVQKSYVKRQLKKVTEYALATNNLARERYFLLFNYLLDKYSSKILPDNLAFLRERSQWLSLL